MGEDGQAQAPGVCVTDVVDPALYGCVDPFEGNFAAPMVIPQFPIFSLERDPLSTFEQAMFWKNDKTQKRDSLCDGARLAFGFVQGQAQFGKFGDDAAAPFVQFCFVVREQQKIIHIADVTLAAQVAFDEMIEGVEVAVRPELAGEVADGQSARTVGGKESLP